MNSVALFLKLIVLKLLGFLAFLWHFSLQSCAHASQKCKAGWGFQQSRMGVPDTVSSPRRLFSSNALWKMTQIMNHIFKSLQSHESFLVNSSILFFFSSSSSLVRDVVSQLFFVSLIVLHLFTADGQGCASEPCLYFVWGEKWDTLLWLTNNSCRWISGSVEEGKKLCHFDSQQVWVWIDLFL